MAKTATLGQRAFVEAIGTFLFVFVGAGSAIATYFLSPTYPALLIIAFANGLGLALAISFAMGISGGHMNPAVTIAALITKRIKTGDALAYIVSQVVGATIAAFCLVMLLPASAGAAVNYGAPSLSASTSLTQGILLEAIMTFFLVFVVFGTIIDSRGPKLGGLAVGLTVVADVLIGGPFTGAAMNPARAIGPAIAGMHFVGWYVYWIGPIIGAVAAALIYEYILLKK